MTQGLLLTLMLRLLSLVKLPVIRSAGAAADGVSPVELTEITTLEVATVNFWNSNVPAMVGTVDELCGVRLMLIGLAVWKPLFVTRTLAGMFNAVNP